MENEIVFKDGEQIIEWAVQQCQRAGLPPTDSALIRVLRAFPKPAARTEKPQARFSGKPL
jgi:hypothetical protein